VKSDALEDDGTSKVARRVIDKTKIEERRLNSARARLAQASSDLSVISVARFGDTRQAGIGSSSRPRPLEPEEGSTKLLKRKMSAPKDGWKDAKGMTISIYADKHRFFHHLADIFWQLKEELREEAILAPALTNELESAKGDRRANLPDPNDYEENLAAMSACEALELDLNEVHAASCSLFIMHKYNQAVVDAFVGDEYFGADKSVGLKERMNTAVKTVRKSSVAAKSAVENVGDPFSGKGHKKGRDGRLYAGKQSQQGGGYPPRFGGLEKQKGAPGG
jgi:hypothetical protein